MKIFALITLLTLGTISTTFASEHLKESKSPLMVPRNAEEVYLSHTFGGITAVVLNLEKVGTKEMLQIHWKESGELRPYDGEGFQIHSDITYKSIKPKSTTRKVILIRKDPRIENFVEIVKYQIVYKEPTQGRTVEQTSYNLSFSAIKNDYEIPYLTIFTASNPPSHRQSYLGEIIEKSGSEGH